MLAFSIYLFVCTRVYMTLYMPCNLNRARPHDIVRCIGNFWVTSDRMLIHPTFTSTVYDDEMLLVVQTVAEKDKWANVCSSPRPPVLRV